MVIRNFVARSGDVKKEKRKINDKREKSNQGSLVKKYFAIVFSIVGIFLLASFLVAMCFTGAKTEKETEALLAKAQAPEKKPMSLEQQTEEELKEKPEEKPIPTVNKKTNVAVFGTDKEGIRTDVNFVVSFDAETKRISLVSIPRDTKVIMTDKILESLEERNKYIPYKDGVKGMCKFNEVHAYAGKDYANEFSVLQLEDLLGITIDYYVKIDIAGFRDVVDAVGGVEMEVQDNLYYNDPYQDLHINLKKGFQTLNGDKAEQLVRYRDGYAQKDLKRIQVQQDFMKAFMKKVLNTDTLINNLPSLISTAFKYVETDFGITDALDYVQYIKDIDMNHVTMETIPGEGGSYFTLDQKGTRELVDRVFYSDSINTKKEEPDEENQEPVSDSKDLKIEVANGGITKGLAGEKQKMLEKLGYQVEFISTYTGEQKKETRIIVKEEGMGEDLKAYFTDAYIETDTSLLSNGIDIKIILGLDEK